MLETRNHPRLRPVPSDSTRTFGRPRVYFPFTRCNRVGCGSYSNPNRPRPVDSRTLHSWPFSLTLSYLLTLTNHQNKTFPHSSSALVVFYYIYITINIKNQNIELKPRTQKPIPHKERETERESLKLSNPQSQWKNA